MLSHVHIGIDDFARTSPFYVTLMAELGLVMKFHEAENNWAGWMEEGKPRPLFLIGKPFDRKPMHPGNGPMTAFMTKSRAAVDRCYAVALAAGGTCEGKPGLRPQYHPNYYGAYFRDPEGNKFGVVCHEAV